MTPYKEEVAGGIIFGVAVVTIFMILFIIWAPASYVLGKWSDYWDHKDFRPVSSISFESANKAANTCSERVKKYYHIETAYYAFASSTAGNYEAYDCYGIKYNKIPLTQ